MNDFNTKFGLFLSGCQEIMNKENLFGKPALEVQPGRRYMKIVARDTDGSSCRVYAFVDKTNGDVLKPASFKQPADHARGNVFDQSNGLAQMSWHGPAYLR